MVLGKAHGGRNTENLSHFSGNRVEWMVTPKVALEGEWDSVVTVTAVDMFGFRLFRGVRW